MSNNSPFKPLTDDKKRELVEIIIRENLDIGCRKIRSEIQREALNGIYKEDTILEAIRRREAAKAKGEEYRDLSNMENFNKLPDLLKPSEAGLSDIEFQVYTDFDDMPHLDLESQIEADTNKLLDDTPGAGASEESKSAQGAPPQNTKILCDNFVKLCMSYSNNEAQIAEFNTAFKKEIGELRHLMSQVPNAQELLTDEFLKQRKQVALNATLLVSLIENKILSVNLWERRFAMYLNQSLGIMNDPEMIEFIEQFIVRGVLDRGTIKEKDLGDLIGCVELFSKTKNNPKAIHWK